MSSRSHTVDRGPVLAFLAVRQTRKRSAPSSSNAVSRRPEGGVVKSPVSSVPGEVPVAQVGAVSCCLSSAVGPQCRLSGTVHWNEEDPAEVPPSCAKCHSTPYIDFLGGDGTEAGVVNRRLSAALSLRGPEAAIAHDTVTFPSGMTIANLTDEARCMECHQGRASKAQVDAAITELAADDVDAVNEELGFVNIHYYAAAATQYGTLVQGGYEYDGKSYDGRFAHVEPYDTCID